MAAQPYDEWTYESYLEFEGRSETRHEYHQGTVYAITGGTREHSLIKVSVLANLHLQIRGKGCEVHTSDILVSYPLLRAAFYPDISAICGEAHFDRGNSGDVLLNPTLIVEVLSQSTERKDYAIKLPIYQSMASVMEILYVRQDRVHITHYKRDGDDWPTVFYRALTDDIVLESIGCHLRVADIYERITWDEA
jgi:Uma2 family endonuclease